jgi:hypothetical protein
MQVSYTFKGSRNLRRFLHSIPARGGEFGTKAGDLGGLGSDLFPLYFHGRVI